MRRRPHNRIPKSNKKWMRFLKEMKLMNSRDARRQLRLDAEHFFNASDEAGECSDDECGPNFSEPESNE